MHIYPVIAALRIDTDEILRIIAIDSLKAHSASENRERRLIASNQSKSAIAELRVQHVCQSAATTRLRMRILIACPKKPRF